MLTAENIAYKPKKEWTLCKDEKPTAGQYIVTCVTYDEHMKPIGVSTDCAIMWRDGSWLGRDDNDIIAWMKLPKPYKEE